MQSSTSLGRRYRDRRGVWQAHLSGKPGNAAGAARKRRSSWGMARNGLGILPVNISPAPFRSSIAFMPASTYETWRENSTPTRTLNRDPGGGSPEPAGRWQDRNAGMRVPRHRLLLSGSGREDPHRSCLFRKPHRAYAFRAQHLFVGTGVIEARCKAWIGTRCQQSGMFWTVRGAHAILALRCWQV